MSFGGTTVFQDNSASTFGGAIDMWGYSGTIRFLATGTIGGVTVSSTVLFENNSAYYTTDNPGGSVVGGAINLGYVGNASSGSQMVFDAPVSFTGNHAVNLRTGSGDLRAAGGGAISIIAAASLGSTAGGAYSYTFNSAAIFRDNFVYSQNEAGYGGAIFFQAGNSKVIIGPGSRFENNYASTLGGAIYQGGASYLELNATGNMGDNDIVFQGNRAGVEFTVNGTDTRPSVQSIFNGRIKPA